MCFLFTHMSSLMRSVSGLVVLALLGVAGWSVVSSRHGDLVAATTATTAATAASFPLVDAPVDRSSQVRLTSYADMLDQVTPAVVAIYPSRIVRVDPRARVNPLEEALRRYYGLPIPDSSAPRSGAEERRVLQGMGSGVIVSADGYVLTNNHVIVDERGSVADEILVRLGDGRELIAQVIGRDPRTDIAVLKVDATDLPALAMADSNNLRVGDVVFAVGNPLEVGLTVTMGIVSATRRSQLGLLGQQGYEDFIQTDASINPGNSGGALVDAEGRLVGINTAILSRTGGNIGIGFAIPISLARGIMVSLVETGEVQRGFLGVSIRDLTGELAETFGLPASQRGALVQAAQEGLPAADAGITRGDIIVAIAGRPVLTVADLRLIVAQAVPGSQIPVRFLREGEEQEVMVTVANQNDPRGIAAAGGGGRELIPGVRVERLTAERRTEANWPENLAGLVVIEVTNESPYARSPLRVGMVIVEINGRPVSDPATAREALRRGPNRFWVFDGQDYGYLVLRVLP